MARSIRLLAALFLCLAVVACQPKHRPVEGNVFIVLQNADNSKLGLVDVGFYDPQVLAPVIEQADKKAREELAGLQKNISAQEAKISDLEQQQKNETEAVRKLVAEHDSIRTRFDAIQSNISAARGIRSGQSEEVRQAIAEQETIRREIDHWNQEVPAKIASLQARLAYVKKIDFAERSKLRPLNEEPPKFPEIGELEREIKRLGQERKEKIESLTEKQRISTDALVRLEEKAKASQKSAQDAQAVLEKEAASLKEKASVVEKKIEEARARALARSGEAASAEKHLETLRSRLKSFNQEYENIVFSALPAPAFQSKTDAEGEFRVLLPYRGNFCVTARATRRVTSDLQENYSWFFRVPPRDEDQDKLFGLVYTPWGKPEPDRLLLSNDNQIRSGSSDSLVSHPLKP